MWGIFKKRDREKAVDEDRIFTRKIDKEKDVYKRQLFELN